MFQAEVATMNTSANTAIEVVVGSVKAKGKIANTASTTITIASRTHLLTRGGGGVGPGV